MGGAAYDGFPAAQAELLRCPADGGPLSVAGGGGGGHVRDGELRCGSCPAAVPIAEGIVRLLAPETLDPEERHEVALRDAQARALPPERERGYWAGGYSRSEVLSTLSALDLRPGCAVADLGCGTGRYTALLGARCRAVMAVDFSLDSLRWMARENPPGPNVGLVHADVTRLPLAPRRFDRALATTPLDTREQRLAMHHVASQALRDDGAFVFSTEHHDLRSRWRGAPRAQRYKAGDNLFFRFTREEMEREAAPYFRRVRARPIAIKLPLVRRTSPAVRAVLSRVAERLPVLRELGDLLLVKATRPMRPIAEEITDPRS